MNYSKTFEKTWDSLKKLNWFIANNPFRKSIAPRQPETLISKVGKTVLAAVLKFSKCVIGLIGSDGCLSENVLDFYTVGVFIGIVETGIRLFFQFKTFQYRGCMEEKYVQRVLSIKMSLILKFFGTEL